VLVGLCSILPGGSNTCFYQRCFWNYALTATIALPVLKFMRYCCCYFLYNALLLLLLQEARCLDVSYWLCNAWVKAERDRLIFREMEVAIDATDIR
jgi:hypothetical protein